MKVRSYHIIGLDCAEEIAALRQTVGKLPGVAELDFNILDGAMSVKSDSAMVPSEAAIIDGVKRAGLEVDVPNSGAEDDIWRSRVRLARVLVAGLLISVGLLIQFGASGGTVSWWRRIFVPEATPTSAALAFFGAAILSVWGVLPKAWASVRRRSPDMNLLMSLAALGAMAIGEWLEGATVAFLFAISLQLESWSVARARKSIRSLLAIAPAMAHRQENGIVQDVAVAEVAVGDTLVVYPGERIPLDGIISEGSTALNEAPITGESLPVQKETGHAIWAGTINQSETITLEVSKPASDTAISRIIRMVEAAQARRAQAERWVDTFAYVYTSMVLTLAISVAILPPLMLAKAWDIWLYNGLVLLVIACPCALVISTPVSIVAALSAAAANGVLIKGGVFLEQAARLRAIAFDKTGTITHGIPRVTTVKVLDGATTEDRFLAICASLEQHSSHPLARAILDEAIARGVEATPATSFRVLPGRGAEGEIDGEEYWIGSHRLLHERGEETAELHRQLLDLEDAGHSVIILGKGRGVIGLLAMADTVRVNAAETMRLLTRQGVDRLVMLTGDNQGTARAVAKTVGIESVHAELLPDDKMGIVGALVDEMGPTAMVGDGINDAPALAAATIGIAMGVAGSEAAIETADIALMADDLERLPWLLRHARRTLAVIRQNITFAIAVKVVFIALTLLNASKLWMAIVADTGASLLVTFNALRLLRVRK